MPYKPQPPFFIQISDANGRIVRTSAGGKHEADLIELFTKCIVKNGVGFFRTEAHVEQDIRDGLKEAIDQIKVKDPFSVVAE